MNTTNRPPRVHELLSAPDVSDWFKNALTSALQRDPVDAVKDAELLSEVLRGWLADVFEANGIGGEGSMPTRPL